MTLTAYLYKKTTTATTTTTTTEQTKSTLKGGEVKAKLR